MPLPGRDPADVEDDRRARGDAERDAEVAVRLRAPGLGKSVAAHAYLLGRDARATTASASRREATTTSCGASCDASIERRVERPLEEHLPQAGLEHPERLEDIWDASDAAPRGDPGCDRVPEAEDVDDIGSVHPRERGGQRGRDAHPAVAKRRRQIADGRPVDDADRDRSAGRVWRSTIVVVTTSTSLPRATSRRTSSPAATTGPPNAREGAQTGAAKRMRSRGSFTGTSLA